MHILRNTDTDGIYRVRRVTDRHRYDRIGNRNILTTVKNRKKKNWFRL